MSTALSAHNGCVSMFRACPVWNTWDRTSSVVATYKTRHGKNWKLFAEPSAFKEPKKNRAPKLRIERLRQDFAALARDDGLSTLTTTTTSSAGPKIVLARASNDKAARVVEQKKKKKNDATLKTAPTVDPASLSEKSPNEWIFVDEGNSDDVDLEWVVMSDDEENEDNDGGKLSYAQVARLAKDWDLSGDAVGNTNHVTPRRDEKNMLKKLARTTDRSAKKDEDRNVNLLFEDDWAFAKSYGERLYHQRKAFKAKRRKSKE